MKKVIIIIVILLLFLIAYLLVLTDDKIKVQLDKCVDGDTAWFKINNSRKKYRFLSIDTMELDTEFGQYTSEYVCNILSNADDIKIEYSKYGETKDKYNRELVFVYIDNELLQEKLITEGYAKIKYVYAYYEYLDKLIELERDAKSNNLALWKEENINYEYNILENPKKIGCKFIGWQYNNKLYDMTNNIKDISKLEAKFDC